jgi:glutathione S-transferase
MSEIILHHYPMSPFAEKIRSILGAKGLQWQSVIIPRIMPKPDLVALTGGYRRTPILQMGANIICDTALISRKLDAHSDKTHLYPKHAALNAEVLAAWADTFLFQCAVPLAFQPEVVAKTYAGREEEMKAFVADRAAMRIGSPTPRMPFAEAKNNFILALSRFEAQLSVGSPFLFGDAPCIADFSLYHPLWFIATKPVVDKIFDEFPNIQRWMKSIAALGHGNATELTSAAAIDIAKNTSIVVSSSSSTLPGFAPGEQILVQPTDYGIDPVVGELLYVDELEVVLKRVDERAGELAVHFPRVGYSIRKPE